MKRLVSIIIPALNEETQISSCLAAISRLDLHAVDYEVIVADNGSTDGTVDVAERLGAKVYSLPSGNVGAVRNFGAKQSAGEVLAFVDADCLVTARWLTEALRTLDEHPSAGAVGATHTVPEDSRWVARAWALATYDPPDVEEAEWVPAGNTIVRKAAFDLVGGFDERLSSDEDCDFCYRLRRQGQKILLNRRIISLHLGTPQTVLTFFKNELWHGRDVFRLFLRSGLKLQNVKTVMYALAYALFPIAILVSVVLGPARTVWLTLCLGLGALSLSAVALALSRCAKHGGYRYLPGLSFLYCVFGIARGLCILNVRNWIGTKWRQQNTSGTV